MNPTAFMISIIGRMRSVRVVSLSLATLISFCSTIAAQTSNATASRSISIGVADGLSLYVNSNLDFGTLVSGSGIASLPITGSHIGKLTISGRWNRTVYVTLAPPASLANGSNLITYTPKAGYNQTTDNPSTATTWPSPSGTEPGIKLRDNHLGGNTGEAYVYLFGSVNITNVPAGTYTGIYTVSVSY